MFCNKCEQDLPEDQFSFKNKARNQRHKTCKQCHNIDNKLFYKRHKDYFKERNKRVKDRIKFLVLEYLRFHSCVDCEENDPIVLDFDHKEPSLKTSTISEMISNGKSWKSIREEIDKCEVRCANCHRRRTSQQFNWLKYSGIA